MATCYNNCSTASKEFAEINKGTSTAPSGAFYNETITIGADVVDKSWIYGDIIIVELWDLIIGTCIDTSGQVYMNPGESRRFTFTPKMPSSGSASFRVSVSRYQSGFPAGLLCQDFWNINISGKDPNASHLECFSGMCKAVDGGGGNLHGCSNSGEACTGGTGGTGCTDPAQIPILGMCINKNDILIAAGIFLAYTFIKSG